MAGEMSEFARYQAILACAAITVRTAQIRGPESIGLCSTEMGRDPWQ